MNCARMCVHVFMHVSVYACKYLFTGYYCLNYGLIYVVLHACM